MSPFPESTRSLVSSIHVLNVLASKVLAHRLGTSLLFSTSQIPFAVCEKLVSCMAVVAGRLGH
jgi:hypothetical protein